MKMKQGIFLQRLLCVATIFFTIPVLAQSETPDLLVSSRNTNSVKRYDGQTGAFVSDFVVPNSGGLNATQEVLFAADGNLLVTGRGNRNILKYDGKSGTFLGNFSSGYLLDEPTKMTLGPDSLLYISQWGQQQSKVARFDFVTGAFVDEFTEIGLNEGSGHAWDIDGNLYVASFGSADVSKFDHDGKYLGVFAKGPLQGPVNLWFGANDDLFVVDWTLGSVLRFDGRNGTFKSNFITGLQNVEGFVFGPDTLLYLCDWTANQVRRYDNSGALVDIFASGGNMRAPNSVVFFPATTPTSVGSRDKLLPDSFVLEQNYPNPFNPSTAIKYNLPNASRVVLKVYNMLGAEVKTLVDNQQQSAGSHTQTWDATDRRGQLVPSGVYFCRIETGQFKQTKKMIFTK